MKKVLIYIALLLSMLNLHSQSPYDALNSSIPQIIQSSQHSQQFEKYINHPVTEYNGIVEINIPLYEIEMKGIKIPIVLSYYSKGIKYKQHDGDVGVGWIINVGGYRITREIRGNADEKCPAYKNSEFETYMRDNDLYIRDSYLGSMLYYDDPQNKNIVYGRFNFQDGENDIFTYMLPNNNGKFIIKNNTFASDSILFFGHNRNKIDFGFTYSSYGQRDITQLKLTDENGFIYYFGQAPGGSLQAEVTKHPRNEFTGWPLQQIISPYNEILNLRYIQLAYDFSKDDSQFLLVQDAVEDLSCNPTTTMSSKNIIKRQPVDKYDYMYSLSDIEGENFRIKFIRSSDSDIQNLVKEIRIEDINGNNIKTIIFDYEKKYSARNFTEVYLLHALLNNIKIAKGDSIVENYEFEYYPGPSRMSVDKWGYYSNESCIKPTGLEDLFLFPDFQSNNIITQRSVSQFGGVSLFQKDLLEIHPYNWIDRAVNNSSGHFSLKKITYPTGGTTEYIYEPNQFLAMTTSNTYVAKKGGGQRIKKIITKSSPSAESIITEYKYGENEDGNGVPNLYISSTNFANETLTYTVFFGCSGWISNIYSYVASLSRMYCTKPITLSSEISNFSINYSMVSIYKNGNEDNGKTILKFDLPEKYITGNTNGDIYSQFSMLYSVYGYGSDLIEEYSTPHY